MPVEDVELDGYVNDYVGELSPSETAELEAIMKTLHEDGQAQMSIVIVDSLDGMSKEQYALEIAHENLGGVESDNGLLVLVAVDDRKYRIEVGYGLEGVLNDAKVGRYGREYFVSQFRSGDYGAGLVQFTKRVYVELTGDKQLSDVSAADPLSRDDSSAGPWWARMGVLPFIMIFFILRGVLGAIFSKAGTSRRNSDDTFAAAMLASMFMRGGGGLGGAGGGFGGFGGGGFGGGGAGGSF